MSSSVGGNRFTVMPSVNTTIAHAEGLYWGPVTRGLLSATLLAIMIASIIGNTLVMVIIVRNKGMRTRTNLLLFNLALTDLLASLLDMPVSLVTAIRAEWIFPDWMCMFNGFTTPLFVVASIHTLMYMSIHKFWTVRHPHSHALTKRRILVMNAAAWCWGIIAAALTISGLTGVSHFRYTTECSPKHPDDVKSYVHMSLAIVTCYAVPAIIILVCSIGVWTTIKSYGERMRETSTVDERELYSQQQHIAVTLFLVVITFGVCWTPVVIYAIYAVNTTETDNPVAHPIVSWFGYLNSACNPIIYAFRSEAFREGYKQVILRKKPGRRSSTSTATLSGGTTSSFNQGRNRINRSSTQSTAGADVSRSSSYFAALTAPDRDATATTLSTMLYDDDGNPVTQIPYSIEMTRLDRSSSARASSPSTAYAESQSLTAEKLAVSFSDNEELAEHLMAADSSVSSAAVPLVGESGTPATSRPPIAPKPTLKTYLSVERLDNIDSDSAHSHHHHHHHHHHGHRGHGGSDNDSANHGRHRRGGHYLGGLFHRATSNTPPEVAADDELAGNEASLPPSRQTSHNINSLQRQQRGQHVGTEPSSRQQPQTVNAAQRQPEVGARRPIYVDRTSANSSSGRGSGRATDGRSRSSAATSAAPATRELSSRSQTAEVAETERRLQQPSSQTRSASSVGNASADGRIPTTISQQQQQQQPAAAAKPKPRQKLRPGTVDNDAAGAASPLGGNPTAAAGHVTVHGTVGNGSGDQRPKPASSGRRSGTPNAAIVNYDSRITEI